MPFNTSVQYLVYCCTCRHLPKKVRACKTRTALSTPRHERFRTLIVQPLAFWKRTRTRTCSRNREARFDEEGEGRRKVAAYRIESSNKRLFNASPFMNEYPPDAKDLKTVKFFVLFISTPSSPIGKTAEIAFLSGERGRGALDFPHYLLHICCTVLTVPTLTLDDSTCCPSSLLTSPLRLRSPKHRMHGVFQA